MDDARGAVFVVDDDASIRKSLGRLIRVSGYAVKTFPSARAFLDAGPPERPACLVLDFRMPGINGLELQKTLRSSPERDLPIVFITGHGDIPVSVRAMREGAVDFLPKPFKAAQLLGAIRAAIEKDRGNVVKISRNAQIKRLLVALTPREREIFALVATGMPNKQAAGRLNISEKTVKIHRSRVMAKMKAPSFADLVRLAQEAGIKSPPPSAP